MDDTLKSLVQSTSALQYFLLQMWRFFFFCFCPQYVSKWNWWLVCEAGKPLSFASAVDMPWWDCIYYKYISLAATSSYLWHSTHVGTLPGSNTTWIADAFKWQSTTKQRLILSVNSSFFFFLCLHNHVWWSTCTLCPSAHYLFISFLLFEPDDLLGGDRVPEPAELQPCSSLSPHPFSPIPLSVAGVTAGPDAAPGQSGFVLQMALSSLPLCFSSCLPPLCLCHVQLRSSPDIYSYANMRSWLISPHTQVLSPYGPPLHLWIFRIQHPCVLLLCMCVCVWIGRGCGMVEGMSLAE